MSSLKTGRELARDWFDGLERQLQEEATQAGLLGHPTMTGDAREFMVQRVLETFLPSHIRVGSGRIIGSEDVMSNQVDLVLFDSRYPAFESTPGQGLFPIEGVIASIEVKSSIDSRSLHAALDNCLSVVRLRPGVMTEDLEKETTRLRANFTDDQAKEQIAWSVLARTHVFSFSGLESAAALHNAIKGWLELRKFPGTPNKPFLPTVVVTGGAVAVLWRDPIGVSQAEWRDRDDREIELGAVDPFMLVWETKRRFGWLASRILFGIEQRRLEVTQGAPIRRSIGDYLPFEDYFIEDVKTKRYLCLGRPKIAK